MSIICKCGGESVQEPGKCLQIGFPLSVVVAIALAVLGSLAVAGLFYPSTGLGSLGLAFGHVGALCAIGSGLLLFAVASTLRCCSCQPEKKAKPQKHHKRNSSSSEQPTGNKKPDRNTTGTGAGGTRVAYSTGAHKHNGNGIYSTNGSEESGSEV